MAGRAATKNREKGEGRKSVLASLSPSALSSVPRAVCFRPAAPAASLLLEAVAVLGRVEERLDHLGLDVVALELVELREPEVVARLVGIAAQVAEVLHQHEGLVGFELRELRIVNQLPQRVGARRRAALERGDQRVALGLLRYDAHRGVERVNELRVRQ